MANLKNFTVKDLLLLRNSIWSELYHRGVIRSENLVEEYAVWLVIQKLGLNFPEEKKRAYDLVDEEGNRILVKARHQTSTVEPKSFHNFRNLKEKHFDYLITLNFKLNFDVRLALFMPHEVVLQFAQGDKKSRHINISDELLADERVEDLTRAFGDD